jgi:ribosomal protein S18 acetylase RimI-like enzyme
MPDQVVDAAPQALDPPRLAATARALARAFRDNQGFVAGLRGVAPDGRERKLRRIFGAFAKVCMQLGDATVVMAGDAVAGAALAYPPGRYPLGPLGWLRNGLGAATIGLGHTIRLARLDGYMHARQPKTPHWYLFVLGVDPAHQGTGVGGRLLARLGERADAAHHDSFLETDEERNVGLYRRYGYEVVEEGPTPLGFRMWHMVRPAR